MAITFCPLCKSMMKEGMCTNRNCGNSQLEIDFIKTINAFRERYPNQVKVINNSYILDSIFNNAQTYKFNNESDIVECGFGLTDSVTLNVKNLCEYFLNNKIPIEVKLVGIATDIPGCMSPSYRLLKFKDVKKMSSHNFKKHKYYFYYSHIGGNRVRSGDFVLASNDLINWVNVGNLFYEDIEGMLGEFERALMQLLLSAHRWTLKIIDNKSGIGLKTFFEKEYAYEFFKGREIKEGKQRRTPLKHIVDDYERNKPKKVLVKEHLRGDMAFEWRGLTFKLYPPIIDEERIKQAKEGI